MPFQPPPCKGQFCLESLEKALEAAQDCGYEVNDYTLSATSGFCFFFYYYYYFFYKCLLGGVPWIPVFILVLVLIPFNQKLFLSFPLFHNST
jgi:hypothetical protein